MNGRIDIQKLARLGGKVTATLSGRHYPRIEDTLLNRVLVSGLKLAGSIASNVELGRESRQLDGQTEEQVSAIYLNAAVMSQVERQLSRLTKNYQPVISIIQWQVESQGIALEGESVTNRLPGFTFDKNAFFQALLSRLLRENLPG